MSAPLETQKVIYDALNASNQLTELLGPGQIFDNVPENQRLPLVVFGECETVDWSSDDSIGLEHFVNLEVWSDAKGRKEAFVIADEIIRTLRQLAGTTPLTMDQHHLVNLTFETSKTGKSGDAGLYRSLVTIRCVTESDETD